MVTRTTREAIAMCSVTSSHSGAAHVSGTYKSGAAAKTDRTPESMLLPPSGRTHLQGETELKNPHAAARLVNLTRSDHIPRHQSKVSLQNLTETVQNAVPHGAVSSVAIQQHMPRSARTVLCMAPCLEVPAMRLVGAKEWIPSRKCHPPPAGCHNRS